MISIITGLFESQKQSRTIAADLENAGIPDSKFIMYLHDRPITKEIKTSLWQHFFKDKTELQDDSLVVSVQVESEDDLEVVNKVFMTNDCIHQNFFENIKISKSLSLHDLKKNVALRAKAQIYSVPPLNARHAQSGNLNSEVVFGKTVHSAEN